MLIHKFHQTLTVLIAYFVRSGREVFAPGGIGAVAQAIRYWASFANNEPNNAFSLYADLFNVASSNTGLRYSGLPLRCLGS